MAPDMKAAFRVRSKRLRLTAFVGRAFNPNVGNNQHRWKSSLGEDICGVLDDAAARLAWAWKADMKYPRSFPMNTSYAFDEIDEWIKECQRGGEPKVELKGLPNPRSRTPKRFSDLVDDRLIRAVFEDQNVGSYSDALRLADSRDKAARFTF